MKIIINEDNLSKNKIKEYNEKARAILLNKKKELLVVNYGGTYLLPGGKIDHNEEIIDGLLRELEEETGTHYNDKELNYLCTIEYFQKNYPKRNNETLNRLITTHCYIGEYKGISLNKIKLTEKEQKGNFKLELIPLNKIENIIIESKNNNPRNIYFKKELLTIINMYKNSKYKEKTQVKE